MSITNHLAALTRRCSYLEGRIQGRYGNAPYAMSEYGALTWALPILRDVAERSAEEARDIHRVRREASYAWLANVAIHELARTDPRTAADLLGRVANEGVRKAVLRAVDRHSPHTGLAEDLRQRLAVSAS